MLDRRAFLATPFRPPPPSPRMARVARVPGSRAPIGLNLYSFNDPLRAGTITIPEVVDYCAKHGLECLDATGYYFRGVPERAERPGSPVAETQGLRQRSGDQWHRRPQRFRPPPTRPPDRRRAAGEELDRSGVETRRTVIRVFAGKEVPAGQTFEAALAWMAPLFRECTEYGKQQRCHVGLQNHNDFIKTAEKLSGPSERWISEWFGSFWTSGSLRTADPYEEIERLVPYAVSWQLKETVFYGKRKCRPICAESKGSSTRSAIAVLFRSNARGRRPTRKGGEIPSRDTHRVRRLS